MEGKNQVGSSSSSFTSELFGSKENFSSSTGIFGSIFSPSSKVLGRESLRSENTGKKQDVSNESWNLHTGLPDNKTKSGEEEIEKKGNRDMSYIYQEQRVQPCHLSSSIYYGGQDIYSHPQSPGSNSVMKKDGIEDDPGIASRGNWWQGSLYY